MASARQYLTLAAVTLVTASGTWWAANAKPTFVIEGQIVLQPADGGGYTGYFAALQSPAGQADSGVGFPDASISVPDTGFRDASLDAGLDASVPDALNLDASVHDAAVLPADAGGLTDGALGFYEPPGSIGTVLEVAALSQPAPGATVIDPTFNVPIRRLTASGSHDYSQLAAMSVDSAYILLIDPSTGGYAVWNYPAMTLKRAGLPGSPRWQPGTHKVIYFDNALGPPATLKSLNIDTGVVDVIYSFTQPYYRGAIVQEEASNSGQWTMAFVHGGADGKRHMIAVDMWGKTTGADITVEGLFTSGGGACRLDPTYGILEPNWVTVTPNGKSIVLAWARDGTERCSGLETYDIKTGVFQQHVYDGHGHGDLGTDPSGQDFFLSNAPYSPDLMMYYTNGTRRLLRTMPWGATHHISCRSPNSKYCVVDGYNVNGSATSTYVGYNEVYMINVVDGSLMRMAHHRSSSCDYWIQPRSSYSPDGKWIVFDSDWGTCSNGPAPYVIPASPR